MSTETQEVKKPNGSAPPEVVFQEITGPISFSPTLGKLAAALAKAQLNFKPVLKTSENPAFMRSGKASKYADLHSLISATMPALAAEGLVIIQSPNVRNKELVMTSTLLHSSGEWTRHELTLPAADDRGYTAHSIGKAMTYARRYSWQCLIGATAEEDDDGNDASGVGSTEAAQAVGKKKVADLTAKLKQSIEVASVPALFYIWHDESQTAEITGIESLKTAHKDLLKPLWNANARAIIANADQLENLKYEFEQRKVEFRPLKAASA